MQNYQHNFSIIFIKKKVLITKILKILNYGIKKYNKSILRIINSFKFYSISRAKAIVVNIKANVEMLRLKRNKFINKIKFKDI